MQTLYALVHTKDLEKKDLYIKGTYGTKEGALLTMKKGDVADFATYFNSFSLKKWEKYTTIRSVALTLEGTGEFEITLEEISPQGESKKHTLPMKDTFSHAFAIEDTESDILGFSIRCQSNEGVLAHGHWAGEFDHWQEKRIGVSITTFKREAYVERTISLLRSLQKRHDWLSILVVDNGRTLTPVETAHFRILPNRNFGGSGGFTRGMLEYIEKGNVDYILLMDDDIHLEPSAIERTHALLGGLKDTYKDSFLAGAMFFIESPTLQHENVAHWQWCISRIHHQNLDCTQAKNLAINETDSHHPNAYAGWWYCCIPTDRIPAIGYPLPAFIKSDDMEYGIRNDRDILSMNGIAVWHESFDKKLSPAMRLFSDRNSLILNHYAHGCGRMTFVMAVLLRVLKRALQGDLSRISTLASAMKEYRRGFPALTAASGEDTLREYQKAEKHKKSLRALWDIAALTVRILWDFRKYERSYRDFHEQKLKDATFWKQYLGIKHDG